MSDDWKYDKSRNTVEKHSPASEESQDNKQPDVDEIAKAVASSLRKDAESWNVDADDKFLFRGEGDSRTSVAISGGAAGVVVRMPTAGVHYSTSKAIASESQDHIWTAYKLWQSDRMILRLGWKPEPPAPVEAAPVRGPFAQFFSWIFE